MREQGRTKKSIASLPHVTLALMSAPGPTVEDAIISFVRAGQRRRPVRRLDILTIKWVVGDLREECRFFFNTQLMFWKKEKDPTTKLFDDEEWIPSLTEAQEITADVPRKFARPIHMGEFSRKYVSRRLFALSEGEIAALMTAMRQQGVGSQGGAEALAIFHQLIYDLWSSGSLKATLARIKGDEKGCFGMIEWDAAW